MDEQAAKISAGLSIIYAGFAVGVAGFGAVAYVVGPLVDFDADTADMLRYISLGLTAVAAIQIAVLYPAQGNRMMALTDSRERLAAFRARAIIVAGSAEAAALFAGVAMLLTGASWHAAPGFILFAATLIASWPTGARVAAVAGGEAPRGKYE